MSAGQKRLELLVFGYVNRTYERAVPIQLIKIMRVYYDEHFYWILSGQKLEAFRNVKKTEEIICPKSVKIKGIEFEISTYPNGTIRGHDGLVLIAIKLKHLPIDIKYVELYREIKCETSDSVICIIKKLSKATDTRTSLFRKILCKSAELQDLKSVCFNCMIDIKHIKYKKEFHKIDYCVPNNIMQKYVAFKWNINGALMQKCHKLLCEERIYSDNFDNNNWCLSLYPNGRYHWHPGQMEIYLNCLSLPYSICEMSVNLKLCVDGNNMLQQKCIYKHTGNMRGIDKILPFTRLKQKESLSVIATLEIISICDKNEQVIDEKDWAKHSVIVNTK